MNADIVVEQVYPHAPERVWKAITDPACIAEWLMENDFLPIVGHRFQFRAPAQPPHWDGIVYCEVITVEPPRKLAYTWSGGRMSKPTTVTFSLTEVEGGTAVRLEHTGFEGPDGMMLSQMLANGWKSKIMTTSLPRVMSRLTERETVGG